MDLAAFIRKIIPNARILGTSTSAIISGGKLLHDQCLISITQMDVGNVRVARMPLNEAGGGAPSTRALCDRAAARMVRDDTKLLFVFSPEPYRGIERFVEFSNERMPGVQMVGGVVDWNDIIGNSGFFFPLAVRYDIACADFSMPALTLEPLVENAIRHGGRKNAGGRGTVVIATRETPECFEVSVTDDGPGFDPAALPEDERGRVGLRNVRERLAQVCGGTLEIESAPGRGTTATIILPK